MTPPTNFADALQAEIDRRVIDRVVSEVRNIYWPDYFPTALIEAKVREAAEAGWKAYVRALDLDFGERLNTFSQMLSQLETRHGHLVEGEARRYAERVAVQNRQETRIMAAEANIKAVDDGRKELQQKTHVRFEDLERTTAAETLKLRTDAFESFKMIRFELADLLARINRVSEIADEDLAYVAKEIRAEVRTDLAAVETRLTALEVPSGDQKVKQAGWLTRAVGYLFGPRSQ